MESIFKHNDVFKNVHVKGEVSGKYISDYGHLYFTLKDKKSQVPCIVYRWFRKDIGFDIENGMNLLVTANVVVYPPHGKYQLDIRSATDDGLGRLYLAYKQLKKKLKSEGLFDDMHKKELPKYPKRIGVVTSRGGSVIHDIIRTVESNWPYCEVLLFPAAVQGSRSKTELVSQISRADDYGLDVLIIARGGGSLEELQSYNSESVVRAIFNCRTPVISAVGHEDDVTLCDLVADRRASTPTMAAGIAVQNRSDIKNHVDHLDSRLKTFIYSKYDGDRKQFLNVLSKPMFRDASYVYMGEKRDFEGLCYRFENVSDEMISDGRHALTKIMQEYVIRHPCKMQVDDKTYHLNELKTRLIEAMNSIINHQKVNLDSATNKFMFNSEKMLTRKRHSLEMSKTSLMTGPCQKRIDALRNELTAKDNKLNREMSFKLKNDKREFRRALEKQIFKNPKTIYLNKKNELAMLSGKIGSKSNEILLINSHELDKIKNHSTIKNPQKIHFKPKDELRKTVEKLLNRSNELIHANDYKLKSIKAKPALTNHMGEYVNNNYNQLNDIKSNLKKSFSSKIHENKMELNFALNNKIFKNPEVLYESKKEELNRIKTSKIIENPYLILKEKNRELKIQKEKLDKINRVLMLKKEQEKQKRKYVMIIVAIVIALILIIIFGGIL